MTIVRLSLLAAALLGFTACDLVRYPGDGGSTPETPEAGPELPEGAPGPPPPLTPISDPYGTDEDSNVSDEVNTDPTEPEDETPVAETPETGETTDPDPIDTDVPDPQEDDLVEADVPEVSPDTPTETDPDTDTDQTNETESPETDTPNDEDIGSSENPAEPDTDETNESDPADSSDETDITETDTPLPVTPEPVEPAFSYHAPGGLLPGTGQGQTEQIVHAPDIVFPIADSPAYLQSMVFTFGGGVGGGDQCDTRNYAYPWRDNFCETRSRARKSPFCPTDKIHQGQDIRVGTPGECNTLRRKSAADRTLHKVVAVEDGVISHIGTYSVNLRAGGRIYKYMHMNMRALQVSVGEAVSAGQHLGYVSNDFGGTPTTFHLHFEITQNTSEHGWAHVPPYLSLVEAYERRENGPGERIDAGDVMVATAPIVIPEGMEIIE